MHPLAYGFVSFFIASFAWSNDSVMTAVEKALPWIEKESQWWIEEKECVSCHHTTFSIWARQLASENDLTVDAERLKADRNWTLKQFLADRVPNPENPDDVPKPGEQNGDRNIEGMAQFLMSPAGKSISPAEISALKEIAIRNRKSDGSWQPNGQLPLQKRPKPETTAISGLWITEAFELPDSHPGLSDAKSTEWYALNALTNQDSKTLEALYSRQNPDGGWSWIEGEKSSPSATGQALLAIGRSRTNTSSVEVVSSATGWLLKNQNENGVWKTYSTKRRERSNRISNFWGTTWAVIGLLESASIDTKQ